MTTLLRGAVVAAFLVLLTAVPVLAHADLEESDPADGATISTPYELTATFSEEFDPDRSFIRVRGPSGDIVAEGGQDPDDPTMMTVDLPELPPGEYTAGWQTVTLDDSGVEDDTFTFSVTQGGGPGATFTAAPSIVPSATARASATTRPSLAPTPPSSAAPTPAPTASTGVPPSASGNDILLALAIAAVVLLGLGIYLFTRRR